MLWMLDNSPQLSDTARRLIGDGDNDIYLSIASLWEITIKSSLGKLAISDVKAFEATLRRAAVDIVPISIDALSALSGLPQHHKDPFDRIIVATAISESLPLITMDPSLQHYPIAIVW